MHHGERMSEREENKSETDGVGAPYAGGMQAEVIVRMEE